MENQRKDAMTEEQFNWKRQDRAEDRQSDQVMAVLNEQGEKADLSGFDPITRAKGIAKYAKIQGEKQRNTAEGLALDRQKMALSLDRIQNIGKEYLFARETGDTEAAEKAYMRFAHHAHNNVLEIEPLQNGKYKLYLLDGTSREIDRPSDRQMDESVKAYLSDPKLHIANKKAEEQFIKEANYKASQNPSLWRNKAGQEIIVRSGFIDPETRRPMSQYEDANTMQPLTEDQVRQGGFYPAQVAKESSDFDIAEVGQKRAKLTLGALGTPEYSQSFTTQAGEAMAPLIGGGYGKINPSMLKAKEGDKVSIQDPDTGKQAFISEGQAKQLDNQLKMSKELLANVKDDKGNSLALLLEDPSNMDPKKGEMLVDKLNRIIQDPKASKEAKHAADSAKFVYQAYGVMPLDRKGTTGKGGTAKQEAPPSAFKEGWNLYGSLKGYPDKQKALLEAWRNSGDPGMKKVVEQIESIRKKIPKTE